MTCLKCFLTILVYLIGPINPHLQSLPRTTHPRRINPTMPLVLYLQHVSCSKGFFVVKLLALFSREVGSTLPRRIEVQGRSCDLAESIVGHAVFVACPPQIHR